MEQDNFIELGYKQADLCRQNADAWVRCIVKFGSQRTIMMNVYEALVRGNRLKKIEDAAKETKTEFWNQAKIECAGTLQKDGVMIVAKCLYAISYLLQQP